jgi:hypothetical protein
MDQLPSPISPQEVEFMLNNGDLRHAPLQLGGQVVRRSKRVFKGVWDFAVQGGAVGAVPLYDPMLSPPISTSPYKPPNEPLVLPPNFIVSKVMLDVLTAPTSGGAATIALGVLTGVDALAATAYGSVTGLVDGIPNGAAANAIKVPGNHALPGVQPQLTIAAAALTAGKINVHFEGYLSD